MGRTNNGNLMNYITFVKNLEVSIYEQQRVLASLNKGIVTKYSGKEFKQKDNVSQSLGKRLLFWGGVIGPFSAILCSLLLAFFCNLGHILILLFDGKLFSIAWKATKYGFFIGLVIGMALALINWMKEVISVRNTNKETDQYNTQVDRDNHIKLQAIDKKNELLSYEIEIVKNNMNRTKRILDNVYSMNIIHQKYRYNVVYICSFYEYFDTGRCNRLEGHEGAYNLLESDIKYHAIMDKLDIIITKLDDIRDSQKELYAAIMNTNKSIQQVNSSIRQLSSTMNHVQDSLNHIEYNSKIAMQNGEFLKWYAYFRDVHFA